MKLDDAERAAVAEVERATVEGRVGRGVRMKGCDALLWELLLVWEAREREHECLARENLRETAALASALLRPPKR